MKPKQPLHLAGFQITPMPAEKQFRFRLHFHDRPQQVEFLVPFHGAMTLLNVLRQFQARYKLPIPLHQPKGRPRLHVVRED